MTLFFVTLENFIIIFEISKGILMASSFQKGMIFYLIGKSHSNIILNAEIMVFIYVKNTLEFAIQAGHQNAYLLYLFSPVLLNRLSYMVNNKYVISNDYNFW